MNSNSRKHTAPRWQPSLRGYLILMNIILVCLLFPTISIFYFQKFSSFRDEQLQMAVTNRTEMLRNKAAQLIKSLSHSGTQAISEYNYTFLNDLIKKAVISDPEFIGCQFVSNISTGLESAAYGFLGTEQRAYTSFLATHETDTLAFKSKSDEDEQLPVEYVDIQETQEGSGSPVLMAISPVYVGDDLWGLVNASFSLEVVNRDIVNINNEWSRQMSQYKISFLTITLIFVIIGIATAIFITRPLLRSISLLREGVDKVSSGNLEHKIFLSGLACDEFVVLSHSFNEMTEYLRLAKQQLDNYSRSLEEQVTERTRELKETQEELITQAHEAGMAEMAVGVLHNIGNAITPVKVGTSTLIERLRQSPLRTNLKGALIKMPQVIQSAPDLSTEEKQKTAAIITLLPESICEEFDRIIDEIEQIRDKHKYIENIISLQMHYAKLKGKADLVDINRVAKDALNILADVILKQGIDVKTSFQQISMVRLEEGKLLQILVNLIKNGCEAMSESKKGTKKLYITTRQSNGATPEVLVSVRDTGCGFTPEEKKHFFNFGYSTKNRGSGFGLHSSANFLIANNGTITARSDGHGLGAEFIIHLPAATEGKV